MGLKKGRRTISPKKSALLKARGITKVSYAILYDLYLSTTVFRTCRGGSSSFQINSFIFVVFFAPRHLLFSFFYSRLQTFLKQGLYCTILISHKLFNPKALFLSLLTFFLTKKHSAGLTAKTERNLAERVGHLELLPGGRKKAGQKDKEMGKRGK